MAFLCSGLISICNSWSRRRARVVSTTERKVMTHEPGHRRKGVVRSMSRYASLPAAEPSLRRGRNADAGLRREKQEASQPVRVPRPVRHPRVIRRGEQQGRRPRLWRSQLAEVRLDWHRPRVLRDLGLRLMVTVVVWDGTRKEFGTRDKA